uniref:Nuclear pore complex protein Nup85 n=2 Tax=Clastoptera arizonana TaxID=38151 RepID=A0A1B6DZI9_9HEMI
MKEDSTECPTVVIPDALGSKSGLKAEWAGIDRLGLHPFKKQHQDKPSSFAPTEVQVHHIRNYSILFDPIVRKLVNDSNGTFLAGQKLSPSLEARAELLKLCRHYRSIVYACIENLQQVAKQPNQEDYKKYVTIFYDIELVWHLAEILYINAVRGDAVLPQLLEWIRFRYPEAEEAATEILRGPLELGAEIRHPEYWDTLIVLIMQGNLEPVRVLLRLHTQADSDAFLTADTMLRRLPVYNVHSMISTSEFNSRWRSWQTSLLNKLEEGIFASYKELHLIMKIISGQSVPEMRLYCQTWYKLMISNLLYSEPTIKAGDIYHHAHSYINQYGGNKNLKLLDRIILSMLVFDLHQVIKLLQHTCDSGWAAAHLTSLLYQCYKLNVMEPTMFEKLPENLDEELLLDYGSMLMSHQSLWQVGVTYLDHCHTQGRARLELLLPRIPLHNLARTQKIIRIATERKMLDLVSSICKIEGMKSLQRHRIGQALNWALQSQDPGFTTYIADEILKRYAKEGVFDALDLLDNLGSCMLISDRLTFLGKYCEFQQLYQNSEFKKAGSLLTSLLASKISPKYFWLTLLSDALPLLERQDVFTYEETCELMSCLEDLTTEETDHPRASKLPIVDRTKLIRLVLTKNMKQALINEASNILMM